MRSRQLLILLGIVGAVGSAILAYIWLRPPLAPEDPWEPILRSGWVVLPVPDSKYEAGTIIQVRPDTSPSAGVRYISRLQTCGYPDSLLQPVVGTTPRWSLTTEKTFDASLLGAIEGLSARLGGGRIVRVGLTIDSITMESIDPLALRAWERDGDNELQVSDECRSLLNQGDKFVVSEVVRVARSIITFYDSSQARVHLSPAELGELVVMDGRSGVQATSDGRVTIDQPVTVALRRAIWAGDGFDVLGPDAAGDVTKVPSADSMIASLYERSRADK